MSQEAYELLLQANNLFSEERRAEAIQAYREVLRLDPTPNQRQVAEAQLRAMGELPNTFSTSGKVIRRQSNQEGNPTKPLRRKSRRGPQGGGRDNRRTSGPRHRSGQGGSSSSPRHSGGPRREVFIKSNGPDTRQQDVASYAPKPSTFSEPSSAPSSSLSTDIPADIVARETRSKPPIKGRKPPPRPARPRRGAVMEGRYRRRRSRWDEPYSAESHSSQEKKEAPSTSADSEDLTRTPAPNTSVSGTSPVVQKKPTLGTVKKDRSEAPSPEVVTVQHASSPSQEAVPEVKTKRKPPKRRKDETQESYQMRLDRFDVWLKHLETYPDIDLNTAIRLEETGWTLDELRSNQGTRKDKYLERKKHYYDEKVEENRGFSGTQYIDTLIKDKVSVWVRGGHLFEEECTLQRNDLYLWRVLLDDGLKTFWPKLQIECMAEKNFLPTVQSLCFVDEEQASKAEAAPYKPEERYEIPDEKLLQSLQNEEPLAFQLYSGMWIHGWVYWYDPYQLSIVLNIDCGEDDELHELIVFRHAVKSILARRPNGWKSMPKLESYQPSIALPVSDS